MLNESPTEDRAGSHSANGSSTTKRSQTTVSATDYYDAWAEQYVLSLDGGGVKGYSSLLILDRLMKYVELEELRLDALEVQTPAATTDRPFFFADLNGHAPELHPDSPDELLSHEEPDLATVVPRDPPCLYFDYVFGTSTGGLIAIMLGRLRMKVSDALEAYQMLAGDIFGQQQWGNMWGLGRYVYDAKKLEETIKIVVRKQIERDRPVNQWRPEAEQRVAGGAFNREPTFHSEPTKCRTVCVAYTDVESQMNKPFLFRSYEHLPTDHYWAIDPRTRLPVPDSSKNARILQAFENDLNTGPAHALPIWQVARATSAAPPLFEPMVIDGETFIDGAVGCNNPARIAYSEVLLMHNGNPNCIKMLLSIGTGVPEVKPMGRGRYNMMLQLVKWATGALTETESTHQWLEMVAAQHDRNWYHRFNVPEELGGMRLDSWTPWQSPQDPGTRRRIERLTEEYLAKDENVRGMREIAAALVDVKRRRMRTSHWNMSASNERYRCVVAGCDNGQKVRNTRAELLKHIERDHPLFLGGKAEGWTEEHLVEVLDSGRIEH